MQAVINSYLASIKDESAAPIRETVVIENMKATFDAATQIHDERYEYEILNLDGDDVGGGDLPAAAANEEERILKRSERFMDKIILI